MISIKILIIIQGNQIVARLYFSWFRHVRNIHVSEYLLEENITVTSMTIFNISSLTNLSGLVYVLLQRYRFALQNFHCFNLKAVTKTITVITFEFFDKRVFFFLAKILIRYDEQETDL